MALTSIREVSKSFGVSTRTLRYYEEVGLLKSVREQDGAFRAYDDEALKRLQQILILRALRIPLKHIRILLTDASLRNAIALLARHAAAIDSEIDSLQALQTTLSSYLAQLRAEGQFLLPDIQLDEVTTKKLMRALTSPQPTTKEAPTMSQLKDVRILFIPPMTVCSVHTMGPSAELEAGKLLDAFIQQSGLAAIKPDFRVLGFNHPNGELPDGSDHGYELWVSIPDGMEIRAPYAKKQFAGGHYAAHMIPMGAFDEWQQLVNWALESDEYAPRWGDPACMNGLMEEHLNYIQHAGKDQHEKDGQLQLDLLLPIQSKA